MKKNILTIFLGVLLAGLLGFVGCSPRNDQRAMLRRLEQLDALINKQPSTVLDSLNTMESDPLSAANEAYYDLLLTIAMDKSYKDFASDSLIASSARWFSRHSDYHNYARALFYEGIVRCRMGAKKTDTISYSKIKKAESICVTHHVEDYSLLKLVNYYLADFHHFNLDFESCLNYYLNSAEYCQKDADQLTLFRCYSQICWTYISLKDTANIYRYQSKSDSVFKLIEHPSADDYCLLYNQKAVILSQVEGDYIKAAEYEKAIYRIIPNKDMAHSYYVIASYYNKAGQIDSAWHYSNEVFKNGVDPHKSINPSFYAFYALHAKLATLTHHLPQAVDSYQKALDAAEDYYNIQKEKRILELEKSYNIAQKNVEIANKEKQIILLILCSLLLLMIVAFLLNNLFASKRKKRKDAIMMHLVTAHTGEVAALSQTLLDTLPQKKELSKLEVVNHISNCTTATRKRIIHNMVSALDDKSEQDQPYSDKEKLILLLIKNGYSTDFIAKLLNVTESNIRSSSARIKHKQK